MAPPPSDSSFSPVHEIYLKPDSEFRFLDKNESFQEKQISVDPISLKELIPTVVSSPKVTRLMELPPNLLPGKPKFLSCSLPNSANSSPRFSSSFLKKKFKNESHFRASPLQHENSDWVEYPNVEEDRQHDHQSMTTTTTTLPLEFYLRRSKSCGEGRSFAPSDDFDLWIEKPDFSAQLDDTKHFPSFSGADRINNSKVHNHNNNNKKSDNSNKYDDVNDSFKCGALCLFLPGFGKAKTVRPSRKEEFEIGHVISRTVSLEKFECGSWASSAIGDYDSVNSYFDLPMELIRSGGSDSNSPVSTAFLFDKDIKGVLKNGPSSRSTSASRKSHESGRHVRFSTASPTSVPASPGTCITPRLRKAREEFNAFLEAQSA